MRTENPRSARRVEPFGKCEQAGTLRALQQEALRAEFSTIEQARTMRALQAGIERREPSGTIEPVEFAIAAGVTPVEVAMPV